MPSLQTYEEAWAGLSHWVSAGPVSNSVLKCYSQAHAVPGSLQKLLLSSCLPKQNGSHHVTLVTTNSHEPASLHPSQRCSTARQQASACSLRRCTNTFCSSETYWSSAVLPCSRPRQTGNDLHRILLCWWPAALTALTWCIAGLLQEFQKYGSCPRFQLACHTDGGHYSAGISARPPGQWGVPHHSCARVKGYPAEAGVPIGPGRSAAGLTWVLPSLTLPRRRRHRGGNVLLPMWLSCWPVPQGRAAPLGRQQEPTWRACCRARCWQMRTRA